MGVGFIFCSHARVYVWTGCALMNQVLFTEGLFKRMELGPGFKAPDPNACDFQVSIMNPTIDKHCHESLQPGASSGNIRCS